MDPADILAAIGKRTAYERNNDLHSVCKGTKGSPGLKHLYSVLDWFKTGRPRPAEVRVMIPGFRPSIPGIEHHINQADTYSRRLAEVGEDALKEIGAWDQSRFAPLEPGREFNQSIEYVKAIAFNAHILETELDWHDDFLDELRDQRHHLSRWIYPTSATGKVQQEITENSPLHGGRDAAALVTASTGIPVDPAQIIRWARAGDIDAYTADDGSPLYDLSQVMARARKVRARSKRA